MTHKLHGATKTRGNLRLVRNTDNELSIYIYDVIDSWFGVSAQAVIEALNSTDASKVHVRINSPGGSVFEGLAIANAMKEHKADVIVHIDSLAASIASVIAMAGDEVRMADGAFLMIHDPWTVTAGNADDLRQQADVLDKIGGSIVKEYVKRSGQDEDKVRAWMAGETWFDAQEAKELGFIDNIDHEAEEEPKDFYDLSKFKHAPAALMTRDESVVPTVRQAERALRDAGFSRAHAKQVASCGVAALSDQRDVEPRRELQDGLRNILSTLTK